jgi:methylase of polypeptide subunit release factors
VWPAAIVLKQYLDSEACISLSDDKAILELGAGTGWLALKVAPR